MFTAKYFQSHNINSKTIEINCNSISLKQDFLLFVTSHLQTFPRTPNPVVDCRSWAS